MTKITRHCIIIIIIGVLMLGEASSEQAGEIAVKDGQTIAFLGDSITANGWIKLSGYVNLAIAGLKANGITVTVIPAGKGGNRSDQMHERLKRDVLDRAALHSHW